MFILPILILLVSLFLFYQGLCLNNIIDLPSVVLTKFTDNGMLMLVRQVLSKYLFILAILGIVISIFLFMVLISKDDEVTLNIFWGYLGVMVLIMLFTII